jgi:AcrR family transcriptional regulator
VARAKVKDEAVSRRAERRERHQMLSRMQLLDAAEEVFGRQGYHETTLKEIAELAEFSVGSVYSFFENKDDLFRQIFVRRGEEFMPQLREVLRPDQGAPVEQLHRLVDFEIGWFRRNRHFGRLYLRHSSAAMLSDDREADATMAANYEESMRLQAGLFERGQEAGQFRPGDPYVLARLFSGIMSAYQALDPGVVSDDDDPDERFPLDELHDVVTGAFVLPAARRRSTRVRPSGGERTGRPSGGERAGRP